MNYLWNPLRIVCIVMVKLFKANSDVIWRLWLWSCACLRRDAWSTVKMTCLVNYPQPEGWRHPGFYDKTTTVTDLMPVLAGQPSSFCQCPSTYFCEGCWVTISCVLVVPVSLPDFSTDLYWSTCLLLTHTSIALDTCHLPIQVGPREGCCTLFSRSDSRFQVAQNVRGIWQPWTHNFSGDLKVLLTLFVIVSICFPQLPARFFMVSWLHWGVGVLPISYRSQVVCTVPVLLQRVVKLPVSRMLVVGPLQWHSDVEKLFPPHVCQVESLLFRLLRWFSVCWLPWWLLQWLGPWPGWSWSQGAGESCSFRHGLFVKPSSEAVMLHLAPREMHDARGWVWAPGVLAYGMGACEIRWIELSNYWKVGSPSGVHVFWGLNSAPSQQRHLQLFHLLDHESWGPKVGLNRPGWFLELTEAATHYENHLQPHMNALGQPGARWDISSHSSFTCGCGMSACVYQHSRTCKKPPSPITWNYLGIRLIYQIIGIMIALLFGAFEHFWTPMTPKISEVMLAAQGTQNQQLVGFGAQMEILPLKEYFH